jgi:hypothetical protein
VAQEEISFRLISFHSDDDNDNDNDNDNVGWIDIQDDNELDLTIVRFTQLHPHLTEHDVHSPGFLLTIHNNTECFKTLILFPGHYSLLYRAESYFDCIDCSAHLRRNLDPLAALLQVEEEKRESQAFWITDGTKLAHDNESNLTCDEILAWVVRYFYCATNLEMSDDLFLAQSSAVFSSSSTSRLSMSLALATPAHPQIEATDLRQLSLPNLSVTTANAPGEVDTLPSLSSSTEAADDSATAAATTPQDGDDGLLTTRAAAAPPSTTPPTASTPRIHILYSSDPKSGGSGGGECTPNRVPSPSDFTEHHSYDEFDDEHDTDDGYVEHGMFVPRPPLPQPIPIVAKSPSSRVIELTASFSGQAAKTNALAVSVAGISTVENIDDLF